MSLDGEDRSSPHKATDPNSRTQKRSKISYTRDFLLSLSELEICKKLPSGFDKSILSEFEDALYGNQDRQRIQGSLPSQGFRRSEYSSSPPTRGDSGNYSRGIHRWDSRSSARSDRDSDSQSDRESDSGRHYGNQSRQSWQGPEHDGLLGSGSFPRPSGYAASISATKVQTNDTYQLNRSNEPYHPPRPYKAVPLSRRDAHDSYNDETFGSTECMSEDKVEEERRRRASFELMRKEQHKALQDKQKMNLEKHKTDYVSDISILDDSKVEKKVLDRNNELDVTTIGSVSKVNSGNSVLPSQTPTFRPLVPPGFTNMAQEKNSGLKPLVHSLSAEVGKNEIEECLLQAQNGTLGGTQCSSLGDTSVSDQQPCNKIMHIPMSNNGDQIAKSSSTLDSSSKKVGLEELLHQTSILPEVHELSDEPEIIELNSKVAGSKLGHEFKENDTTSILEKIFGNPLTVNIRNSMDTIEHHDNKPDETWSPSTVHSSKFAHWFVEEERKTADEHSLSRPNDLLSLIVGGDKSKSLVSGMNASDDFEPQFPYQSSELADHSTTSMASAKNVVSEPLQNSSKQGIVQNILTCEDLEQTILSEYSELSSSLQPTLQGLNVTGAESKRPRAHIDDQASQHILSLLQKGTSHDNTTPKIDADIDTSEKSPASDVCGLGTSPYKTSEEDAQNVQNSGKTLTLETLFGTAFMKELQSVEAPVSVQRGSVGSAESDTLGPQGLAFPVKDNGLFPSATDHIASEKTSNTKNFLASNNRQQMMLNSTQKWLGGHDAQVDCNLSKNHPIVASKHGGFDGAVDYQLPEGESLIAVNDDLNPQLSKFLASANTRQNESLSSNASGDISEKLAAIGAAIRVERSTLGSDGPPFVHGPYNQIERGIQYRDLHAHASSPHFHSQQTTHGRPLLQPLDSHPAHINSQLRFMGPDRMNQQDASGNQQFPANMLRPPFHLPNVGVTGFELPGHRPMLQQMQMPGNYPSHLVNDFSGTPVPRLSTQATGFMQEPNPLPGYPFGSHQPNIGGHGLPIPASDTNGGSNHPEAFQRLIDMERRANSKQMPPLAGHSEGMYGHELDLMPFR